MKKVLLMGLLGIVGLMGFVGCQEKPSDGKCHIYGTVADKNLEGKRIFLVPFTGPATAETVDSMEVTNGKFEFTPDSMQMYKILMDYHFRMGTETLLVIAEPGVLEVIIDSVSSAKGTPQNDSLQAWKELTQEQGKKRGQINKKIKELNLQGDFKTADELKKESHESYIAYKKRSRQMAANMKGTILGDFLKGMFPLTYKRKMPDGKVVELDADTDEPVK